MAVAGSIVVDLLMKTGSFETDANRAAKVADKRAKEMARAYQNAGRAIGSSIRSLGGQLLAFAGVSLGVSAAVSSIKDAIDKADGIRDLSIRIGASTETLSAFGYAAAQTGTDIDTLGRGMKILAKNAAAALNPTSAQAKIFDALGISVQDARGNLKQMGELIPEIADKFKGMADGTTKAALAQALFGKSGLDLTEFLNSGSDGLKTFTDRARELGIVIGQDTADAADKFNDDLNDLKTAAQGLALKVAQSLMPELDKLVVWASAFVSDGAKSAAVAEDIAAGFSSMAEAGRSIGQIVSALEKLRDIMNQIDGMSPANAFPTTLGDFLKKKFPVLYKNPMAGGDAANQSNFSGPAALQIPGLYGQQGFNATSGRFNATAGNGSTHTDSKALALALSNPTAKHSASAKKAGKSEEEKSAERLQQAYASLISQQQEQIALFGKTGEAARVRYDTEFGALKNLSPEQKAQAIANAENLDAMEAQAKLTEDGKQLTESLMTVTEHLNKQRKEAKDLLDAGAISQDTYNRALADAIEPGQQILKDLQFELDLLKMTNAERATAIALRGADADAVAKYGDEILAMNQKLEQASETTRAYDEVQRDLSDSIFDVVTGAKSATEAFKGFFDSVAKMITQMIAEQWSKKIMELFSNGDASGQSGGWWGAIAGLISGGGKAGGGDVVPGSAYLVGENGPEMFVPRTVGTVMTNGQTMAMAGGGGGFQQNVTFMLPAMVTRQTQEQIAQRTAVAGNRASSRNR